jgi:ribonuclease G
MDATLAAIRGQRPGCVEYAMSKEIIIQARKKETRIALLDDGALAEFYVERPDNSRTIGDIYLARVRNVMPSIQAAFVDIGQKQDAFLHFSDVGETLEALLTRIGEEITVSDIPVPHVARRTHGNGAETQSRGNGAKTSRREKSRRRSGPSKQKEQDSEKKETSDDKFVHPAKYLRNGQRILVQVVKEPISNKGSRVTGGVTLAGRFLVLVPFGDYVAVSRRIWSQRERKRLQTLAKSLLPPDFGLIVRTVAQGKDARTLDTDLRLLVDKWRSIEAKIDRKPKPPQLLHQDVSMVSSVVRDLFTDDYDRILVDDHRLHRSLQTYIRAVAPHMLKVVKRYDGSKPVFEEVGISGAIAEAFSSRVDLPTGGYIYVEHTEAMHVIDVNSGRASKGKSQEDNSLKVNLEAADVIAKQLRLRDLGGIIVVDFIDLRDTKNRNKVVNRLKQAFRKDRAVTKVLPMSDFGLIQITRQRLRPSITTDEDLSEELGRAIPSAEEVVETKPHHEREHGVDEVISEIQRSLIESRNASASARLILHVHPFLAAFLKRGLPNKVQKWSIKHRVRLRLQEDDTMRPTAFRLTEEAQQKAA